MKRRQIEPLPRCACSKVACIDIEDARQIRLSIWAVKGGRTKVRFYTCKYGYTHWTREELRTAQTKAAA